MEYIKLGNTGLDVSRVVLGCMTYGEPQRGGHPWTLDEEKSRPLIKQAIEAGINFFDTANVYSDGSSEEIVGRALKDFTRREEVVIATKVHGRMRAGPNGSGLSRKAIMQELDASLLRLGTDYVDLYQIHRFDYATPMEETLEALNDVVRAGKVRYVGASSMYAWQFAKMLSISKANGWARFVTMQNFVNLLYREEEREMLPLCAAEGIGAGAWPANPAMGRTDGEIGERRIRQKSLQRPHRGRRPQDCRDRRFDRAGESRSAGPGCAGMGIRQVGDHRTDRRRFQAPAYRRRGRLAQRQA
jgi:aryl-alcohol dehydrogenase-like predicted oxidoreductase